MTSLLYACQSWPAQDMHSYAISSAVLIVASFC